jgi:hypothetical protein
MAKCKNDFIIDDESTLFSAKKTFFHLYRIHNCTTVNTQDEILNCAFVSQNKCRAEIIECFTTFCLNGVPTDVSLQMSRLTTQ